MPVAATRFRALPESEEGNNVETAGEFRARLDDHVRTYGFLARIVPYQDACLERLYPYGRHLTCSTGCPASRTAASAQARWTSATCAAGREDRRARRVPRARRPRGLRGFGDGTGGGKDAEVRCGSGPAGAREAPEGRTCRRA